jgi:penicillin-binding protein 2
MYNRRVQIFITFSALLLLVCILRLAQIQLMPNSRVQDAIAELKRQRGQYQQLKTLRGKILDRNGKIIALDEPRFELHIDYSLTCFADERVRKAKIIKARRQNNANILTTEVQKQLRTGYEDLHRIIDKCVHFGLSRDEIEDRIDQINDKIWNLRRYLAWKRNYPDRDFEQAVPDANEQILLTAAVNIAEMHKSWPLLELNTDDDIFAAQVEFMDIKGVEILPHGHRFYPYRSIAAQTIGWVGPATQEQDKELFVNDRLATYIQGEVCGREDGVEYVCEAILRGRRGELIYDIDHQLISRTETQFGKDVRLTLDIELQQRIEQYLANYNHNPVCGPGMAAVVLDVATGDILALASLPVFDLNRARYDYSQLVDDPNKPLINRAINKQYPPGSVVKPLILIAGLESDNITADEVIECPAEKAPFGWPNCWIYNRYRDGHSNRWENYARNAIRGSCNIYFSRLADRIEPLVLQQWLFKFGYGRVSSLAARDPSPDSRATGHGLRELRQVPGQISSGSTYTSERISSF